MRAGAQPLHEREPTSEPATGSENGADRQGTLARLELVRPGLPAVSRVSTAAALAHERTLPLVEGLHGVIPAGCLQRGATVAVHGPGSISFGLAVVAEAVRSGSFLAIVAPESFNMAACLDFEIPLRRVVQFILPPDRDSQSRAQMLAAIIEGFDMVLLADRQRVTASQSRQLVARTRERGSVLVRAGGPSWSEAADLRFDLSEPRWQGVGRGHGHLQTRVLSVQAAGRRLRGKHGAVHHLMLPGDEQGVARVAAPAAVVPAAASGDQFAGSDIDEMLDAVDEPESGAGASAVA